MCEDSARRVQKSLSDALKLEVRALVNHLAWVLGPEFGPLRKQPALVIFAIISC